MKAKFKKKKKKRGNCTLIQTDQRKTTTAEPLAPKRLTASDAADHKTHRFVLGGEGEVT